MTIRDYSETRLHIACVDYLRGEVRNGKSVIKTQRPFHVLFLHPVNEFKDEKEAFWGVRKGILAGASDLLFWWPDGKGAIELKSNSGLSPAQIKFKEAFIATNGRWALCKSVKEVRDTLIAWGLECHNMLYTEPKASKAQQQAAYMELMRPKPMNLPELEGNNDAAFEF